MSEIERILREGKSARDEQASEVSPDTLAIIEDRLGFSFPNSYREFVSLGGLAELRIHHQVLSPDEIIENLRYVDSSQYIPLADNGCGDLYCWKRGEEDEPKVVFVDHETDEEIADSSSFTEWLARNRF